MSSASSDVRPLTDEDRTLLNEFAHEAIHLYELALAIDTSLNIEKTCHTFLGTLQAQRDLEATLLWVHTSLYLNDPAATGYTLLYPDAFDPDAHAFPEDAALVQALSERSVISEAADANLHAPMRPVLPDGQNMVASIALADVGILQLVVPRHAPFLDAVYLQRLAPICNKFAAAVRAGLVHHHLQAEMAQRRKASQEILEIKNFYEQVLNAVPAQLAVFDAEARYLFVSPSGIQDPDIRQWIIGRTNEEYCIHRGLDPAIGARRTAIIKGVIETGERSSWEESFANRHGDRRHFIRALDPITNLHGDIVQTLGWGIDITDRKQAEERLRTSEQRYKSLVEAASDMIYRADLSGQFTYVNPVALRILGLDQDTVVGRHYLELVHPDDRDATQAFYQKQREESIETTYCEFRAIDAAGDLIWIGQNVQLVYEEGTLTGVQAVARDITERKAIEHERQRSEAKYAYLFHHSNDPIILHDIRGQILDVNERCIEALGYTRNALLAMQVPMLHPEADLPKAKEAIQKIHTDGFVNFEVGFQRADGSVFAAEVSSSRFELDGQVVVQGMVRDITERKKAEEALRESEARKRAILDVALDCVISIDERGHIIDFNPAAEQTFGYARDAVIGQSMAELIIPEAFRAAHERGLQHFLATGEGPVLGKRVELTAIRASGAEFPVELAIQPIPHADGYTFTAYLRDITERKWAEEELIKANKMAEASVKAKEQFLANMSHEMRTPLNAVIGMTHLLGQTAPNTEQQKYLGAIKYAADNLLALINDILDFAKIGAGKVRFEAVAFRIDDILRGLHDTFRFRAEETGLAFGVNRDIALPEVLIGDPTRLNQILMNLLSNALKFTEKGSVALHVALIRSSDNESTLSFKVSDTGIGIPADKLEHIFDSFTQASSDTTRRFGGTGLGLSIVRELVDRQGGNVSVDSTESVGTTFIVQLTFAHPTEAAAEQLQHLYADVDTIDWNLRGARILLVEDNEMNQWVAQRILEQWNAQVEIANNGAEALRKLAAQSYDLILMDIQMPEMDGYEATRQIRETLGHTPADLPILALTASTLIDHREDILKAGMNDFILKPFDPKHLFIRLKRYLPAHLAPAHAPDPDTIVDLQALESDAKVHTDFILGMIGLFLDQAPAFMQNLHEALATHDWSQIRFTAHKMKSSAGFLGMTPLVNHLRAVEAEGPDEPSPEAMAAMVHEAIRLCDQALVVLREKQRLYQEASS